MTGIRITGITGDVLLWVQKLSVTAGRANNVMMGKQQTLRSVSEKMGIKDNARTMVIDAPDDAFQALGLPGLNMAVRLAGNFDYIHLFVRTQHDLDRQFPKIKKHLSINGMLWISWPKAGQLETDLNIRTVIRIGYDHGLVESKAISINAMWSALKFTHPKKDKVYKNSYGTLKD